MGQFDNYINNEAVKAKEHITSMMKGEEDEFARQSMQDQLELFNKEIDHDQFQGQRSRGLITEYADARDTASFVLEQNEEKFTQSTFEQRTDYYFKNTAHIAGKVGRYRALGDRENPELVRYSEKYRNKSAKKRAKKANAAADCFERVRQLEERANQEGENKTPIERYRQREEIMRLRMEGMINAAKVKSTSSANEGYRIAKAKITCLSMLFDQAKNLNTERSKDFMKIQNGLMKEIADAQADLKKYATKDPNDTLKEASGYNDDAYIREEIRKSEHPDMPKESMRLHLLLNQFSLEASRDEYHETRKKVNENKVFPSEITKRNDEILFGCTYIKRDKNGMPINKEEIKKQKRNEEWLKLIADPEKALERRRFLMEKFEELKKLPIPTPEELRKKGAVGFLREHPWEAWEIHRKSLLLDNMTSTDPVVAEYYKNDKVFKKTMDCALWYTNCLNEEMRYKYSLTGALYKPVEHDEGDEENFKENMKYSLKQYEREYNFLLSEKELFSNTKKNMAEKEADLDTFEKAKEEAKKNSNKAFNENSYKILSDAKKCYRIMSNAQYQAAYRRLRDEFGSREDLSRNCGSMLRNVHFDAQGLPVSKEDIAAHEWNMTFLNNREIYFLGPELSEVAENSLRAGQKSALKIDTTTSNKSLEKLMDMIETEYKRVFSNLDSLPDPDVLEKELTDSLSKGQELNCTDLESIKDNPEKYVEMAQKSLCYEGLLKRMDIFETFNDKHPEYSAVSDVMNRYSIIVGIYYGSKYGIALNTGGNAGVQRMDKEMLLPVLESYKEEYKKAKDLLK